MAALTAADLLALARQQGLTAFDSPPRIGFPSKILLASLGIDVRDLATQDRLVELNRAGEIRLTRVDADWLVPVDRRQELARSRFWHTACWFDSIAWDGRDLGALEAV